MMDYDGCFYLCFLHKATIGYKRKEVINREDSFAIDRSVEPEGSKRYE